MNIDPDGVRDRITLAHTRNHPGSLRRSPGGHGRADGTGRRHDLVVIEDCAHAVEGVYRGRPVGTIGDFGCFSFYATKNLTTGEGGMVLARRDTDIARVKVLALHGMRKDAWRRFSDEGYRHYQVVEAGFKYNMMDLQAAIGLHQLERIETDSVRRAEIWDRYMRELAGLGLGLPAPFDPLDRHALHLFTVLVDQTRRHQPRRLPRRMTAHGIGVGVHYQSIPEHPYYQERLAGGRTTGPTRADRSSRPSAFRSRPGCRTRTSTT